MNQVIYEMHVRDFTINKDIMSYEREDKIISEPTFKPTILIDEQDKSKVDIIKTQKSSNKPIVV